MLYVTDSDDPNCQASLPSLCTTSSHGLHHAVNTPKRQSIESEASFDSGYFSPLATRPTSSFNPTPELVNPPITYPARVSHQSPSKIAMMASVIDELTTPTAGPSLEVPILDDWDKNFIENFEENLFSLDISDDSGLLEGLFRSPGKSPIRILSPAKSHIAMDTSPLKLGIYRSPHKDEGNRKFGFPGKRAPSNDSRYVQDGRHASNYVRSSYHVPNTGLLDSSHVNPVGILSASENRSVHFRNEVSHSSFARGITKRSRHEIKSNFKPIRKTKENSEPCLSKQKLQMARANFRLSLQKALESADLHPVHRKSTQYPQLSKALSKRRAEDGQAVDDGSPGDFVSPLPASSSTMNNPYLEEDAEIPSSWIGTVGTEVGAYEVEPQSDCKVVIRKRRK